MKFGGSSHPLLRDLRKRWGKIWGQNMDLSFSRGRGQGGRVILMRAEGAFMGSFRKNDDETIQIMQKAAEVVPKACDILGISLR